MQAWDLEFPEDAEEHLARHGISLTEVLQIFDGPYTIRRNRGNRTADRVVIGKTHGGAAIAVFLAETAHDTWVVITGRPATEGERNRLP